MKYTAYITKYILQSIHTRTMLPEKVLLLPKEWLIVPLNTVQYCFWWYCPIKYRAALFMMALSHEIPCCTVFWCYCPIKIPCSTVVVGTVPLKYRAVQTVLAALPLLSAVHIYPASRRRCFISNGCRGILSLILRCARARKKHCRQSSPTCMHIWPRVCRADTPIRALKPPIQSVDLP